MPVVEDMVMEAEETAAAVVGFECMERTSHCRCRPGRRQKLLRLKGQQRGTS